jgi:protein-L-isoaspartate(D-aspartate) O-methyltransferase
MKHASLNVALYRVSAAVTAAVLLICSVQIAAQADDISAQPEPMAHEYAAEHAALLREIEANVRRTRDYLGKDALDPRTMQAMASVPRHEFVPAPLRALAYADRPLPIGYEQTISQPYIVAIMTDLLSLPDGCTVLDVGTGSGYQAAVLAEICDQVYTIEIVEPLGREAAARLERLGYENVQTRIGDGFFGWPEAGPFDAIIVAANASKLPPPLIEQIRPGGRMIIPIGSQLTGQDLILVEKDNAGQISTRSILPVIFVPLTGDHDGPER